MLVTFQSQVDRITMHGDVAVQLIRMLGRSGKVPSALLAADIPDALDQLQGAIAEEELAHADTSEDDEKANVVSLRQRAIPLIELLQRAEREKSNVMWEQGGAGPLQF